MNENRYVILWNYESKNWIIHDRRYETAIEALDAARFLNLAEFQIVKTVIFGEVNP